MISPAARPAPRPAAVRALPIRPRPAARDTPATYIRRLARANHLRPAYLKRYLRDDATGQPSIDMLAALAARPASSLMHAFSQDAPARRRYLTGSRRQELFETIRRDAGTRHRSIRALWSTPGLVETRFSPDALVWVAVVFHGTAAWRNHGLIIFRFWFYRTSVQLRCPAAPPGGGLRPVRPPTGGLWASPRRAPAVRRGFPGRGKGDAQRHRLRRRRRP